MNLKRYNEVDTFYIAAESLLLQNEAANCLPIGLCSTLCKNIHAYSDQQPYFVTVDEGNKVVAAALMTPPYNLTLAYSDAPQRALESIARDLLSEYDALPGVTGPKGLVEQFAGIWQELTGKRYELVMAERIYKLEAVQPVRPVPGHFRQITPADRQVIISWLHAFHTEADPEGPPVPLKNASSSVDQALQGEVRRFFVWDDGGPVTFAGSTGPTPNGIRIGPVYTPPEQRRKGYASACVAALSQLLLDEGRQFVFLFTDLANPTSNHIYREIGYEPVIDVNVYSFS